MGRSGAEVHAQSAVGSGQLAPGLQAGPAPHYSGVQQSECRFLETVELLDGQTIPGEVDLRGFEDAFLGGERFWGQRVVEIAPASAWLSSYVAARAGDYVALDLPGGGSTDDGWESLHRGWWFVMQTLGLDAAVVRAERHASRADIGSFDVALLPCVLSRCADPLWTLQRAAELSDDTVIVTEPVNPHFERVCDEADSAALALLHEPRLAAGPRWALSVTVVVRLLAQLGLDQQVVTRHQTRRLGQSGHYATIVAHRPAPRPRTPPGAAQTPVAAAPRPPEPRPPEPRVTAPVMPAEVAGGLPLPPPEERRLAVGTEDAETFLSLGRAAFASMAGALLRDGADIPGLGGVLDFGCGFGRVLRHWRAVPGLAVYGTDVNVAAILWNRERLGYGEFEMNTLDPRFGYPDGQFGLAYAIGVFNHLPENLQLPWIRELLRVVRPGGYLYFTTFSAHHVALRSPQLRRAIDGGQLVVNGIEQAGTDECTAFHAPEWVIEKMLMPAGAALVEYRPANQDHPPQDCWLCRKRG